MMVLRRRALEMRGKWRLKEDEDERKGKQTGAGRGFIAF